jgi:hypothetical protein
VIEADAQLAMPDASVKVVAATATLNVKTEVIVTARAAKAAVNFLNEFILIWIKESKT